MQMDHAVDTKTRDKARQNNVPKDKGRDRKLIKLYDALLDIINSENKKCARN